MSRLQFIPRGPYPPDPGVSQRWVDDSGSAPVLRLWDGTRWESVNDTSGNGGGGQVSLTTTATKTADYATPGNEIIPVDVSSVAEITITLPSAPAPGTQALIKKTDSTGNPVNINAGGSDVVDSSGNATTTLTLTGQAKLLQYSGGVWLTVLDNLSLSQLDARYAAAGAAPTQLSQLSGLLAIAQQMANGVGVAHFTSANAANLARPTNRTDICVIWIGDPSTNSTMIPANALTSSDLVIAPA